MRKINKRNVIIFSVVLLLLVMTAGVSFAFFSYIKESNTENSVTIGNLTFKYTEVSGVGNGIAISDAMPMSDEEGKILTDVGSYFDFKVESTLSRSDLEYEIVVEPTEDSTLPLDAIKFYLTDITNGIEEEIESTLNDGSVKKLSEFNDTQIEKADGKTIYQETILRNTKSYLKEFRARMWVAEDIDWTSDNYLGKSGAIRINVYANSNRNMASNTVTTPQDTSIERVTANNKYLFTKVENEEYQYTLNVPNDVETLDINVIPSNTEATSEVIQLSRIIGLQYGDNFFRSIVTSSDGSKTQEYILRVYRELDRDNSLFSLEVDGYSLNPVFDPNETNYNLILEASSIELNATATSSLASISGIGTKELNWGENKFDIIVTSQSGELKTYKITIINERPTAPQITGGSTNWVTSAPTISLIKAGTTISGIKHYEYYKTTDSTKPTDSTAATGTTTGNLTVNDEGTTYIWYRTVSNNGFKSAWTNTPQVINLDTIKPTIIAYGPTNVLYDDSKFESGTNGIVRYNNRNTNDLVLTRKSMTTNFGTSNALEISTIGGDVYPELGGFVQTTRANDLNEIYIHHFIAKIPVGYTLNPAFNYLGENFEIIWLSSKKGTGDWSEYAYMVKTGSSYGEGHSSLSTFGHVFLSGGSYPVTWYVSYSNMSKVNDNKKGADYWFRLSDNNKIESYQITSSNVQPTTWKEYTSDCVYHSPTTSGTYYIWTKDIAGNISNTSYSITVDDGSPSAPTITGGGTEWTSSGRVIKVSSQSSAPSGISKYQYYISTSSTGLSGGKWTDCTTSSTSQLITQEGTNYIYFRAVSKSGKFSDKSNYQIVKVDITPPTITVYGPTTGLYGDPMFTTGTNGIAVYNNLDNGNVTITRGSMTTNFGTSNALTITTNGTASPGLGGFYQNTTGNKLNDIYIHYFIAKIPTGYKLNPTANYLGEGHEMIWLSNNEGTGNWASYAVAIKMGSSYGTTHTSLGNFGHIYLSRGSAPVTWHLSYATMNKVNVDGTGDTYWFDFSDDIGVESYQITTNSTQPSTGWQSLSDRSFINHSASPGTYYLWLKDTSGNVSYKKYTFK